MYFFYKVRWYAGVLLLLAGVITLMKYSKALDRAIFSSSNSTTVSQQSVPPGGQQPSAGSSAAPGQAAISPLTAADPSVQLAQMKLLLDEASTSASEALKEVVTWKTEVEPLHDQVLAEPADATAGETESDEDSRHYDRLAFLMRKDRTDPEQLHEAVTRIDSLQLKINDLMQQSAPAALSPIDIADINRLHGLCKQAEEDWQREVGQALAIKHLLIGSTDAPASQAAPATVGSKIQDADARAAAVDVDQRMVREKEEEAARRARKAELDEQRREREEAKAKRLAEATAPEVKALLAPFLEPRSVQPSLVGTFSIKWVRTDQERPMSLGALREIGALDDSVVGRQKLALIVGHRKLPEPKWSITSQPHGWSPEDEQRLKQAQQMLRDHGAILIEAGLLSE